MKRICNIFFVVLFIPFVNQAQNYYYSKNTQHYWQDDSTSLNIILRGDTLFYNHVVDKLLLWVQDGKDEIVFDNEDDNIIINSYRLPQLDLDSFFSYITSGHSDNIVFYSFAKNVNNHKIWLRNEVNAIIRDGYSFQDIQPILLNYNTYYMIEKDNKKFALLSVIQNRM